MKTMTAARQSAHLLPAFWNAGVNISSDHSAIGSVSKIDRPTPRKAFGRATEIE
jgi:hypothetical protein